MPTLILFDNSHKKYLHRKEVVFNGENFIFLSGQKLVLDQNTHDNGYSIDIEEAKKLQKFLGEMLGAI